jgi:hypothetical protein
MMSDIAQQRLSYQHIAQPTFENPAQVVEWLGAVQAQDYLASLWGLGLRISNATDAVIEQAIADRSILRTWPMRGTVHFVPARDAKWMLRYLTPRVVSRAQSVYRTAGLDDATFMQARTLAERALEGGKQLARNTLYEVFEADGIATGNMRGLHIVGWLASQGVICFGPREGKQPTFVLLDEWVPNSRMLEKEEALAELARRYFISHGPATVQDFAWWTGLPLGESRSAIEAVKSHLVEESIEGNAYWRSPEAVSEPKPSPAVHLLPAFDEYVVSYKDRSAALDANNADFIKSPDNHLGYITVIDGQVVGNWKRTIKKNAVAIEFILARSLNDGENDALAAAAQRYGGFLGLPVELGA